ncbi:hypothetical protein D3OALGB2SA_2637 [Olavius algarvensis associated proteobacterium Delta 3]|nr:hypothetical protein D3OALGB2SA_2637 [Olavius algarvensis associated proteobacterium Delta 3]
MQVINSRKRFYWLDITRGLAILWIFLVHFVERFMCCPNFGNPNANWPPVTARFTQLAPLDLDGIGGAAVNVLRYVGWMGDQGVQIFVVASGFGLAISALSKPTQMTYMEFFRRRLVKLVPLWVLAHLLFIATYLLLQKGLSPFDWRTWASLLGFRFMPQVFYFRFPAWWYIGLLLQLYFIFPLMLHFLRRWTVPKFLLVFAGISILLRLVGLVGFEKYLDWWSRGGIFIARMPEFAFGMAFAKWIYYASDNQIQRLRSPTGIAFAVSAYLLGNISSFFLVGMSVAFFLTGSAFFVLVFIFFSNYQPNALKPISWFGKKSYALYLFHHPVILFLVPRSLPPEAAVTVFSYLLITFFVSVCIGPLMESVSIKLTEVNRRWYKKIGISRLISCWALLAFSCAAMVVAAEIIIRKVDPQEVLGWGERPSLAPHPEFGYYLKPNKKTRLRWLSYDYTVNANALGFPGKLYSRQKPEGAYRIFITGDAFSSAEGVDTGDAWPRLLETLLQDSGVDTQVMNFSITGWGPNQYAKVISKYVPEYKPDLILISFFVNEFFDVAISNTDFQKSIGFTKMSPSSLKSYLRLTHLRAWLKTNFSGRFKELILNKPNRHGYFFGYFQALHKEKLPEMEANAVHVKERLESIATIARGLNASVLVVIVPAPAQVCDPNSVKYWPRNIELNDSVRFDLEQPQRLAKELLNSLSFNYIDLRVPLRQAEADHPCQPRNLHWTEAGHKVVAGYIAQYLLENHDLRLAFSR